MLLHGKRNHGTVQDHESATMHIEFTEARASGHFRKNRTIEVQFLLLIICQIHLTIDTDGQEKSFRSEFIDDKCISSGAVDQLPYASHRQANLLSFFQIGRKENRTIRCIQKCCSCYIEPLSSYDQRKLHQVKSKIIIYRHT